MRNCGQQGPREVRPGGWLGLRLGPFLVPDGELGVLFGGREPVGPGFGI